ncbi:MAG: hypothetical protein ABII00_01730, partial [Elusimicrobiota bacterium]
MRGIVLVALAGLLSAAIFWTWRGRSQGEEAGLDLLTSRVDGLLLRWAREQPATGERFITFVLSDPFAGTDPMGLPAGERRGLFDRWFAEEGAAAFTRPFEGEPGVVVWNLVAIPSAADNRPVAAFARILVKAADAGAHVRVIARGRAAGLAV